MVFRSLLCTFARKQYKHKNTIEDMNKSELKPAAVFEQFAKINQIPRPSKPMRKATTSPL